MALLAFFCFGYLINITYISVFYHRGLAHRAIILSPRLRRFVLSSGNWITGIDPTAWSCMHRLHHLHSDTERDPHSPVKAGILRVLRLQLNSYKKILARLCLQDSRYTSMIQDIGTQVHWTYRRRLWILPYLFQALLAVGISLASQKINAGLGFYLGLMSHPIQGWLVNSFGHAVGYRNFPTPDHSRNNLPIGWLVFGEGFQNNHHYRPSVPNFSVRWWEVDLGFLLCLFFRRIKLIQF